MGYIYIYIYIEPYNLNPLLPIYKRFLVFVEGHLWESRRKERKPNNKGNKELKADSKNH